MNRIFNQFIRTFVIILIVMVIFSYFGVYLPLRTEIIASLEQNFTNFVDITEVNIENKLNRYLESVESVSSRTMIKQQLNAYHQGEISFEALSDYTQPKYHDGVVTLDHLISSFRITDDKIIADYNLNAFEFFDRYNNFTNEQTVIKINTAKDYVLINAPIKNATGEKIGNDVALFELEPIAEILQTQQYAFKINNSEVINRSIHEDDEQLIEHRQLLTTDYYLTAIAFKDNLYGRLNNITFKIVLMLLLIGVIITLYAYHSIKTTSATVIEQLKKELKKETKRAETDYLLDIYNRDKFTQLLKTEMKRSQRYDHQLSLIMFDIDNFKEINDTYGHTIGDDILLMLKTFIERGIREYDIFARYGGDEFMIITPETDRQEAKALAERLQQALKTVEFPKVKQVTCSFGVTSFKANEHIDTLIERVDQALYQSKEKGRDQVSVLE
jgi:diguanylate cyclase (GGDEF)-like protein